MNVSDIRPGKIVKHYERPGDHYEIIALGRDGERRQRRIVTYRSLRTGEVWNRPATPADKAHAGEGAFCETVEVDGVNVERFSDVGIDAYEEVRADEQGRVVVYTEPGSQIFIRHGYQASGTALLIQKPCLVVSTERMP